jgi:hypothetical protein
MELKPPCAYKEVIGFDFNNLSIFLEYLDNSHKQLYSEITQIKTKITVIPDILTGIKDLKYVQETHKKKIENLESSLFNQQQKIMDLDINQRGHAEVSLDLISARCSNSLKKVTTLR